VRKRVDVFDTGYCWSWCFISNAVMFLSVIKICIYVLGIASKFQHHIELYGKCSILLVSSSVPSPFCTNYFTVIAKKRHPGEGVNR
jgi:hypothetical protein